MTEAWFSPETARVFSFLSLMSLCSLLARPAQRGQLRRVTTGIWNAAVGLGVALLVSGVAGGAVGQPPHVTRTLLLSGFAVGFAFVVTRRAMMRHYEEAELRRTVAADL
jgi:hypothetical protein